MLKWRSIQGKSPEISQWNKETEKEKLGRQNESVFHSSKMTYKNKNTEKMGESTHSTGIEKTFLDIKNDF